MFCSKCGSENKADATYCWSCGAPIQVGQPSQYPSDSISPPLMMAPAPVAVAYAGFWRRFLAFIIDAIILSIPGGILGWIFGVGIMSSINNFDFENMHHIENFLPVLMQLVFFGAWVGFIKTVIKWLYHALFESSILRATPGKLAIGIVVTDSNGNQISFLRATGRHFAKYVSGVILLIGYMMAGWTEKKQALHDMMADCLVVKK